MPCSREPSTLAATRQFSSVISSTDGFIFAYGRGLADQALIGQHRLVGIQSVFKAAVNADRIPPG